MPLQARRGGVSGGAERCGAGAEAGTRRERAQGVRRGRVCAWAVRPRSRPLSLGAGTPSALRSGLRSCAAGQQRLQQVQGRGRVGPAGVQPAARNAAAPARKQAHGASEHKARGARGRKARPLVRVGRAAEEQSR